MSRIASALLLLALGCTSVQAQPLPAIFKDLQLLEETTRLPFDSPVPTEQAGPSCTPIVQYDDQIYLVADGCGVGVYGPTTVYFLRDGVPFPNPRLFSEGIPSGSVIRIGEVSFFRDRVLRVIVEARGSSFFAEARIRGPSTLSTPGEISGVSVIPAAPYSPLSYGVATISINERVPERPALHWNGRRITNFEAQPELNLLHLFIGAEPPFRGWHQAIGVLTLCSEGRCSSHMTELPAVTRPPGNVPPDGPGR